MRIFSELKRDHTRMRELLSKLGDTTDRSIRKRTDLLNSLKAHWAAHTRAEEEALYRNLLDDDRTYGHTLEALDDHRTADALFEDLEDLSPSDSRWRTSFDDLRAELEHHFDSEEAEIFVHAKKFLARDEAEEMGDIFEELRLELLDEQKIPAKAPGNWTQSTYGGVR